MGREKVDYRDLLMRLDEAFPQQETLTRQDVAAWLGVSRNTIRRRVLSGWPTEAILTVPPNKRNTRAGYITRHGYRTEADHDAE